MRNYLFHYLPLDKTLQVKDQNKKTLFTICKGAKSVIYLDVFYADGKTKENLAIDEILDLIPDATIQDVKNFASYIIYLFARGL